MENAMPSSIYPLPFIMQKKISNDDIINLNMVYNMFSNDFYVENLNDIILDLAKTKNTDNTFNHISNNIIYNVYFVICFFKTKDAKLITEKILSNVDKIFTVISNIYSYNTQNNLEVIKFNILLNFIKDFNDYPDKQKAIVIFQNILKYDPIISSTYLPKLKQEIYSSILFYPNLNQELYTCLEEIQKYESKILGSDLEFEHT